MVTIRLTVKVRNPKPSSGPDTMSSTELSKEHRIEFRDRTISSLIKWAPLFCPGIENAFQSADGVLRVRSGFIDPEPCEGFRVIRNVDTAQIRARIESESMRKFGVKFQTDRMLIGEYIEILADKNRVSGQWLGDIPQWDGTPRLKAFGELFGLRAKSYMYNQSAVGDLACELAGRALFMHPCLHAQGIAPTGVPVVVMVGMSTGDLREFMSPIIRGPMREVTQAVTSEQKFAEAFDASASHILLPGIPQVLNPVFEADRARFASVVSQSSVYYRPPNSGLSSGVQIIVPGMVATVPDKDWKVPIIPTVPLDCEYWSLPDAEVIEQCYAEAMHYVAQGVPILQQRLAQVCSVRGARA